MCGPHGLKFLKPVELRLPHCASMTPDGWSFALKSSDSSSGMLSSLCPLGALAAVVDWSLGWWGSPCGEQPSASVLAAVGTALCGHPSVLRAREWGADREGGIAAFHARGRGRRLTDTHVSSVTPGAMRELILPACAGTSPSRSSDLIHFCYWLLFNFPAYRVCLSRGSLKAEDLPLCLHSAPGFPAKPSVISVVPLFPRGCCPSARNFRASVAFSHFPLPGGDWVSYQLELPVLVA